jgi:transcriptional regulator with XRE-family HTH domain
MTTTQGGRLRALRTQAGLSLLALATRAGCSPTTLYGVERYERRPRPEVRGRIARALGVDSAALWDEGSDTGSRQTVARGGGDNAAP